MRWSRPSEADESFATTISRFYESASTPKKMSGCSSESNQGMPIQWPSSRDYVEAIQNPPLCFQDPDLRLGSSALDRLGMPFVTSGQFAYVFKLNGNNDGEAQAVRC